MLSNHTIYQILQRNVNETNVLMVRINLSFLKSQTAWVKFGAIKNVCFVGREVIGVGDGCYIIFYNLSTKEDLIYTAIDDERGHGVKCLSGHKTYNVFAFGEIGLSARIYVLSYPDFNKIVVLPREMKLKKKEKLGTVKLVLASEDGLLCLAFSEANFLVSLEDLPDFGFSIWNWRNGEKIATRSTDILVANQILRCSYGSPVYVAQMSVNEHLLNIWDVLICGKRCLITQHKITPATKSQRFVALQFTSEGSVFVQDDLGDINMVNNEYKLELVIKWGATGVHRCSLAWYKGGLLANGPDGELRHYKKSGNWASDWKISLNIPIVRVLASVRDSLVALSENDDIMYFDTHTQTFVILREHESFFNDFCLIYPTGETIVTMARNQEITAWEVSSGNLLDSMTLGGPALSIAENPEYPYFAVGFGHGMLQLFSIYTDNTIKLLTSFHLTRNSISKVSFVESGLLLVAADMSIGEFFVIEGRPGTKMQVVATCCANRQIADFILVASQTCFRLFALNVNSQQFIAGNVITRFCVIRGRPCPDIKDYYMEKSTMYSKLYANKTSVRDRKFYAQPLNSKFLHEMEVKRGDDYARYVKNISSKHQMRKITYHFTDTSVISYGYDGLVLILKTNFDYKASMLVHHRTDGGVVKAFMDPLGKYIVALGRNNTLACLNITDTKIIIDKNDILHLEMEETKAIQMFQSPTFGFLPRGDLAGKTWLEVADLKLYSDQYKKCEKKKHSILKRFKAVRNQLRKLLSKNLQGPENEYLDIQEFNLDTELKNDHIIENAKKCKETKIYLEALIAGQDKVSKWIKSYCWDPMSTQGKTIFGIFSTIDVENYTLLPTDLQQEEILKYIEQYRDIEKLMANCDIFEPWVPRTVSEMKECLNKQPGIAKEQEDKPVVLEDILGDETDLARGDDVYPSKETHTALVGSTAHHFVDPTSGHYDQCQIKTFYQTEYQTLLSKAEEKKLMEYFNKEFDNLMSIKVRDMTSLADRNARLRHIISELNFFSKKKTNIIIIDPVWKQQENPEEILDVADKEISITPYISPSQQAILDAEAAERERIRLLMLADDFKERALMAMMNGVLEIRWEDELKKDVPKPKCMLEKQPEEYKEDDLRTIKEYEEKVRFLESERLRYRRMLCAEYSQVGNNVRESIKKFNSRVEDLLLLKMKVDSAVDQECFRVYRMRLMNFKKIQRNEMEKEILKSISHNEKVIDELQRILAALPENVTDIRSVLEALQTKERLVEKAFRREMQDASPAAQEIALKLYRKRPKTNVKTISSVTVLQELSKCVVTKERTPILTADALDFLKAMDTLDLYIGIPSAVDEHLYSIICKHRRLKIESEIKIRAITLDINEAESTIAAYHKNLTQKKELAHKLAIDLAQIRQEKLKSAENMELQLVIKQGYVELPQTGRLADFNDAILVSRKDIEDINEIILKGGNKKLKAMREAMTFRRGILAMEWTHKKMKRQIADLVDHLKDIDSVKVTKEVQTFLKSRARGESPDKGMTFEQEVGLVKNSYLKIIEERREKVKELQIRINLTRKNSKFVDKQIVDLNVDVCEQNLQVDQALLDREKRTVQERMEALLKRTKLVKQIQENHNEILVLQTELELLRLKTYPTLKYKIFP